MGIFNMFIVIPQIIAALGGVNFVSGILGKQAINAMTVAGISLIIAGFCNFLITNNCDFSKIDKKPTLSININKWIYSEIIETKNRNIYSSNL